MKKIFVKSYGCQMNKLDSVLVAGALKEAGFEQTDDIGQADAVVINTCSVRQHAEQRVLSNLGHLKHIRKSRPQLVVAVIGCMAQRMGNALLEHEAADIVAGPGQIPQVSAMIIKAINERSPSISVSEKIRDNPPAQETAKLDQFEYSYNSGDSIPGQAFVRVMRGCNKFCSYCVVPYVRGPEISRPPELIIRQVRKLAQEGIKQITLLGQTVNSYLYSDGGKMYNLADLLWAGAQVEGIEWIKFITSYPARMDAPLLEAMAKIPKVCPYLHLPAQSGSDRVLKAMNRGYTVQEYLEIAAQAKATVPGIAIASDFIVGFPDESEADFDATMELVKKVRFKNSFIFRYSPRPGTGADKKLPDSIPFEVKQRRNAELLELQNKICGEDNKKFVGMTLKILVEGTSKKALRNTDNQNLPQLIGRTMTDHIVVFNGSQSLAGEIVEVKITDSSPLTLFGKKT